VSLELKPAQQHLVWQRVWMQDHLLPEELEGREPHATVEVVHLSLPWLGASLRQE
jgi:hypothetical protein